MNIPKVVWGLEYILHDPQGSVRKLKVKVDIGGDLYL